MSYYERHIFFCLNQREGENACTQHGAQAGFDHCKSRVKAEKLAGPGGVRVNKAGCLDQCELGPTVAVYPEGVFYGGVRPEDVDEIIDSHVVNDRPVERLRIRDEILNTTHKKSD